MAGKWAVLLGASGGIGSAIARRLAADGMNLCLVYRDRKQQEEIFLEQAEALRKQGVTVWLHNRNALQADDRKTILDELNDRGAKVFLLVHAVSRGNLKLLAPPLAQHADSGSDSRKLFAIPEGNREFFMTSEDLRLTAEAMAYSLWDWAQDILQRQLWETDSRIIGLTSEGTSRVWPYYAAVSTAKAALESLCRSMAVELGPYGIRTNIVQSGVVDTPSLRMIPGNEQMMDMARARNPLGRLTQPEDVAGLVSLLCRREAAWVNGALIRVDGGEGLR